MTSTFKVIAQYSSLLLLTFYFNSGYSQHNFTEPDLKDTGADIQNRIELIVSTGEYNKITKSKGKKIYFQAPEATINGNKVNVKEFNTRGKTTLFYRRKSFSFDLDKKVKFYHGDRSKSMKEFKALSLAMDRNYIRNRIAFEMMDTLGIFRLFYSYGEITLNGKTEGIYMIMERAQDWALKTMDSPLIIRRGFNHFIDNIKTGKEEDKESINNYKQIYNAIYKDLKKYEGEELYQTLSKSIDLEMYMRWLAFNFYVRNGDYTDEVYFYFDPSENRYKVIPWDYDDIFAKEPHEGMAIKKSEIGNKYIFSSEDELDQKIALDPYLYQKYTEQLALLLNRFNEDLLRSIFEKTYSELYPYFQKEDILEISRYDNYQGADTESLEYDLNNIYTQLVLSRLAFLNNLESK